MTDRTSPDEEPGLQVARDVLLESDTRPIGYALAKQYAGTWRYVSPSGGLVNPPRTSTVKLHQTEEEAHRERLRHAQAGYQVVRLYAVPVPVRDRAPASVVRPFLGAISQNNPWDEAGQRMRYALLGLDDELRVWRRQHGQWPQWAWYSVDHNGIEVGVGDMRPDATSRTVLFDAGMLNELEARGELPDGYP